MPRALVFVSLFQTVAARKGDLPKIIPCLHGIIDAGLRMLRRGKNMGTADLISCDSATR